ncbi:helix-turn-helix transcriptional regulator [Caballeronia sp. SEWSISQ10-4 2]|uniref:helix-turn-helix transcriptional regulator n=1 Tax=Caballeronia sp. SEWSISQ10-4 2 TaxID=2937438 RepID=UPI003462A8B9
MNERLIHSGERLLRLPQVLDMVGPGKTRLYEMMKTGEFPQSRKIRHMSVWVESEVQDWIRVVANPKSIGQDAVTHINGWIAVRLCARLCA